MRLAGKAGRQCQSGLQGRENAHAAIQPAFAPANVGDGGVSHAAHCAALRVRPTVLRSAVNPKGLVFGGQLFDFLGRYLGRISTATIKLHRPD